MSTKVTRTNGSEGPGVRQEAIWRWEDPAKPPGQLPGGSVLQRPGSDGRGRLLMAARVKLAASFWWAQRRRCGSAVVAGVASVRPMRMYEDRRACACAASWEIFILLE